MLLCFNFYSYKAKIKKKKCIQCHKAANAKKTLYKYMIKRSHLYSSVEYMLYTMLCISYTKTSKLLENNYIKSVLDVNLFSDRVMFTA